MLKLSKKVEYALISMIYMAQKHPDDLTTARELAERFQIPHEMMGKVLQALVKNGLIGSAQGIKGGYRLQHLPEETRVSTVVTALEGPIHLVGCAYEEKKCNCRQSDFCNIKDSMRSIQSGIIDFFDNITLKDLQKNSR